MEQQGVTVMQYRSIATIISSGVIGLASLAGAPSLQAQYRAVRWATSARAIHCAPAPLTERPGVQAEYNRPHVVPLEESFADAQSVKRSMAYRARSVAMENR
jgi:hypothetical protein